MIHKRGYQIDLGGLSPEKNVILLLSIFTPCLKEINIFNSIFYNYYNSRSEPFTILITQEIVQPLDSKISLGNVDIIC